MKKIFLLAALALTMAACSNEDNITEQPAEVRGIPFSATISTGGGSTTTRAITGESLEGDLSVEWKTGELVALDYYVGSQLKRTRAKVETVSGGKATITATLNQNVTTGTAVTLTYPYWDQTFDAATDKFNPNFFTIQSGLLTGDNSISNHFDLRKGTGTITLATGSATLSSDVTMESQIAIWRLTLKDASNNDLTVKTLEINYNGTRALADVSTDKNVFYMAVPAEAGGASADVFIFAIKSNGDKYYFTKSGVTLAANTYYQSTVKMNTFSPDNIITSSSGNVELQNGDMVTGTGGTATHITIADGATVTLCNLTNTAINHAEETAYAGIECMGNATIILVGSNSVKGVWNHAGISVPKNKTLTISGGGSLTATGDDSAAGIGGNTEASCGNITIIGGTVNATGGRFGAGIGSGCTYSNAASCGNITISGGTVNATGGGNAAGIGDGDGGTCGDITISGGTVNAKGGTNGAGIGSGCAFTHVVSCGSITISGGTVNATGGEWAAGIGSGNRGKFTSISITSGITSVIATRSNNDNNVPIGKGKNDQGNGSITIDGEAISNDMTKGTAPLPAFTNLKVEITDGASFTNGTWTITKK